MVGQSGESRSSSSLLSLLAEPALQEAAALVGDVVRDHGLLLPHRLRVASRLHAKEQHRKITTKTKNNNKNKNKKNKNKNKNKITKNTKKHTNRGRAAAAAAAATHPAHTCIAKETDNARARPHNLCRAPPRTPAYARAHSTRARTRVRAAQAREQQRSHATHRLLLLCVSHTEQRPHNPTTSRM